MDSHERNIDPVLGDRYDFLGELGRGGMGVVYKAQDRETGELVALKLLKPEIADDHGAMERFKSELRLARRITHKNVCRIYEFSRAGRTAYVSMEFVDGQSLRALLDQAGKIQVGQAIRIAQQICAGLREAHAQGVVHRDLKPENVMLDRSGNVKLMDFGIARSVDAGTTLTGVIVGTPAYMAPEQAEGRPIDPRADIYTLGLILYEMLSGAPAFAGDTPLVLALKQIRETPRPLMELAPEVPPYLQELVYRCLEKDPTKRFQSVDELEAALSQAVALTPGPEGLETVRGTVAATFAGLQRFRWPLLISAALGLVVFFVLLFQHPRSSSLKIPFREFTLKNGLQVILSEDHSSPTYSICVTYNVGSRDEHPGRTGVAHLFEHMMFQGSKNVGKGEHYLLIRSNGGNVNGAAYVDWTQYFQTLPANQLDLGLFLEADRMRSLVINQANLDNQRHVVKEERRRSLDNQPYGRLIEAMTETPYDSFAYKHSVFGSMEDLDAVTVQDLAEFFRIYYSPNNATLTLVGDFKAEEAMDKIKKYFDDIPAQPRPPGSETTEPGQKGERRKAFEDAFAQTPLIAIGYKVPPGNASDWYALSAINEVLAGGQSSRLYQKLVKETEVAATVASTVLEYRGPSLVVFVLFTRPGIDLTRAEKMVYEEIERIKNEAVKDWEIEKVRTQLRRRRAQELQTSLFRSLLLGRYAVLYNDPALINTLEEKIDRVTPDEIQRVARSYLKETNRTVVIAVPRKSSPPSSAPTSQALGLQSSPDSKSFPISSVQRKNKAPVSNEILRVRLPEPVEANLDNGLTVLIIEDHRFPNVSIQCQIGGAGPIYEPANQSGLADATAQMLREGTKTRTSRQIAEEVDRLGATLGISSRFGSTDAEIAASGLSNNFDDWFTTVTDVLLNPTFPADQLNSLKQRLKTQLQQRRSLPDLLASRFFNRAAFGNHPAAVVSATPESIDALTPEALSKWHRERYCPQNTVLGIAGDVRAAKLLPKLKRGLANWQKTDLKEQWPGNPVPASARKIYLVDRPNSVQTTIEIGAVTIDRRNPDCIPLEVMNQVIGGSAASRLFVNLREEKGYAYAIGSFFTPLKYPGPWRVRADLRVDATEPAITEIFNEIRRIREQKVSEAELEQFRRIMAASFALSLEQPSQLLNYAITRKVYGFSFDYWDTYPAKILAVSPDDVQRVARKYINPEMIQVVAVGDVSRIKAALEKHGPVQVYDSDGNALTDKVASVARRKW